MLSLKHLLRKRDHLLNRDIKSIADLLEKSIWNVEVDHQNIPINGGLRL